MTEVNVTRDVDVLPVLRLALAMRGGVSLAVWIGGAVAELDLLRCARHDAELSEWLSHRRDIYARLLDLADFAGVEIDVLAGASAGGLNAVLYGTAQSYGRRVDDMKDVWSQLAHFPALLRQSAKRRKQLVPSLLRGDQFFYARLRERLRELVSPTPTPDRKQSPPSPPAKFLSVALSATMLPRMGKDGVLEKREPGAATGRASFGFARRPTRLGSRLSDVPVPPTEAPAVVRGVAPGEATIDLVNAKPPGERVAVPGSDSTRWAEYLIDRLALAGRSTSSFPAAFEPARVPADATVAGKIAYAQEEETTGPFEAEVTSKYVTGDLMQMPNMADVFSATRPHADRTTPFEVVDGGVFDNIGIARALAAIANAPADRPTRRWLLYLDPDPGKPPVARPGPSEAAAYTVPRLALRLAGMRSAARTVRDDLEALQEHNERALARRSAADAFSRQFAAEARALANDAHGILRTVTQALRDMVDRYAEPDDVADTYAEYRASVDLPRLTELVVRPQLTIGTQIWYDGGYPGWTVDSIGEAMVDLRMPLYEWYCRNAELLGRDLSAVMEVADFLITWTRTLERWLYEGDRTGASPGWADTPANRARVKRVLYRVLFVATALRDLADHEMLNEPPAPIADRLDRALRRVLDRQAAYRLPEWLLSFLDPCDEAPGRTGAESDADFYDAVSCYLASGDVTGDAPAAGQLWRALEEAYKLLQAMSPTLNGPIEGDATREWRESPFQLFTEFPEMLPADQLWKLGPIYAAAGGLPDSTTMVSFGTVSADTPSPLDYELISLKAAVRAGWAADILKGKLPDATRPWLDSNSKLAGNQLSAFGGFLSARWRANDWMWGRADAAATTVNLLVQLAKDRRIGADGLLRAEAVDTANRLAGMVGHTGQERLEQWTTDDLDRLCVTVTASLQRSVTDELLPAAMGSDDPTLAETRRPPDGDLRKLTTGAEKPGVLSPQLRSSLIMCLGILAARAVWPSKKSLPALLLKAGLLAVRPLWMLLLLFGMPARAFFVLALALGAASVEALAVEGRVTVRAVLLGVVAAAGCAYLLWRASSATTRTRQAREVIAKATATTITASQDLATEALSEARRAARWRLVVAIVVTLAVAGGFVWWFVGDRAVVEERLMRGGWPSLVGMIGLVALGFIGVGRLPDLGLRGATGKRHKAQPWVMWILALLALGASVVVPQISWRPPTPTLTTVELWTSLGAGAALVLVLVLASTFDWMRRGWWLFAAVAMGLVAYGGLVAWLLRPFADKATLGTALLVGLLGYVVAFAYGITAFCKSRDPKDS